jgi:hypothetical protein
MSALRASLGPKGEGTPSAAKSEPKPQSAKAEKKAVEPSKPKARKAR